MISPTQKEAPRNFDAFFEPISFEKQKKQSKFLRCFAAEEGGKLLWRNHQSSFAGRKSRRTAGFPVPSQHARSSRESFNNNTKEASMSGSVNKTILVGNLGKDPEIRSFQNGGRAASFSVATSESWKDKDTGERKERTEWHRVFILNDGLVGVTEKYLKKGAKVYVEGRLETRKWTDRDGIERYSTEIVLRPYSGEL